ncbi:MAG: carbohydrate binding family 9 domain-containing protein [Candidatus Latescibacteria bacterium]|nr:carbohydrate binding family 9 domain-containing protein [Candidatus Latescibacterota bacterium]
MTTVNVLTLTGLFLMGAVNMNGWAQEATPRRIDLSKVDFNQYTIQMVKVEQGPRLDGVLDDEVWQRSPVATGFIQWDPDYLAPSTERTEVRALYDEENLYISAMCYDSEPDKVVGRETRRDANIFTTDDTFAFAISPFPDRSNAYFFNTSPLGAQRDAFVGNFGESFNDDWDGIWRVRAKRNPQGWSVEVVIPFKTFRFPPSEVQTWGVNFRRQVRRKREESHWPPKNRADGFNAMYRFERSGRLVGLEQVQPGRALELLPYSVLGTIGKRSSALTPSQTSVNFDSKRDIGGDLKWGVTPNITADATVNPDFANIESDQEVVNLSRFEFRFDEKRPFFLEGVDLFSFGQSTSGGGTGMSGFSSSSSLPLFFSRRIGTQNLDGSVTPIDFATKLTGKVERTSFAYFNAQTGGITPSVGAPVRKTNWQVMRVRQNLGRESSIGVMALFKEPGESFVGFADRSYNRVLGVDNLIRFGKTNHRLELLAARSWLSDTDPRMAALVQSPQSGNTWAGSIAHRWRNQYFNVTSSYTDIREGFYADMGFIQRRGVRQASWTGSIRKLIRQSGIRETNSSIRVNYTDDQNGNFFDNPESWDVSIRPFFQLENGASVFGSWTRDFDTLTGPNPVQIAGVHFPKGEYTYDRFSGGLNTDPGKALVVSGNYSQGKFYDGDIRNIGTDIVLKPIPRLLLNLNTTFNHLDRTSPTGTTATQFKRDQTLINRLRFNYSFTPEFYISSFVQLNHSKKTAQNGQTGTTTALVSNLLIAYQMQVGHSFYIAYNQVSDDDYGAMGVSPISGKTPFKIAGAAVVAKFQYLFNI